MKGGIIRIGRFCMNDMGNCQLWTSKPEGVITLGGTGEKLVEQLPRQLLAKLHQCFDLAKLVRLAAFVLKRQLAHIHQGHVAHCTSVKCNRKVTKFKQIEAKKIVRYIATIGKGDTLHVLKWH